MHMWDVDGNAISGKMLETYLYDALAIIYVYDVTSEASFQDIEAWTKEISLLRADKRLSSSEEPMRILFGNKSDMNHVAEVNMEQHNQFAQKHKFNASYVGSAKNGDKVF